MAMQLYLVNPPARKGRTNERAQSGGLGVSRKLKPGEHEEVEVLAHDFLYTAAVAEQAGHRVRFIDLILERIYDHQEGIELARGLIARGQSEQPGAPVWIGVRLSIPSLHSDLRMANMLKQAFPHARVYAFGNIIMTTYRHWFHEARFDYIFYGEPEAIIAEAMDADDPATVAGVIDVATHVPPAKPDLYDPASNVLHRNWRKVQDISTLPRAAWHLLELERYSPTGRVSDLALSIPASRGCFMPCTMCAYNLHEGRSMRFRTPEEVLDELDYIYQRFGIRHIRFRDPNFSANKPHLQAIAQGIVDRQLPLEAAAELSLELLDRPLMELLYRAGIRTILTGVESNDAAIMKSIGQNVKISRILEGKLALANEIGLKVYTFFIVGAPEETWHTVKDTFTFARSLPSESTMTLMTPFPGTPMYWRALKEGLLVKGREMTYEDWNSYTATMRTYRMGLRDLALARTWARLETRAPHLRTVAARLVTSEGGSLEQRARAVAWLAPRAVALGGLRLYGAWKLRQEEKDPALRTRRASAAPASAVRLLSGVSAPGTTAPRGIPVAVQNGGPIQVASRAAGNRRD